MRINVGTGSATELGDGCTDEMAARYAKRCEAAIGDALDGDAIVTCTPDAAWLHIRLDRDELYDDMDRVYGIVRDVLDAEWQRFVKEGV